MMNFWKQHNPNNITEKPPHYRSKSDGGAVLLYLDFLTVLEGEADIVSAVSRSTPTQSQRNRIFFETVKGILSALPFFHIWTPTCLCAIQRFHRAACAGTVQIRKGLEFPNKPFATQNSRCIYVCTACCNGVGSEKLTASERYRCPSLYFFKQLSSASDIGSSWTCLFFRCRNVIVRSSKDISCFIHG